MRLPIPGLLTLVYASAVAVGTILLLLPWSANVPVSFMDALFTATSAVTVTGLVVLDTGSDFTLFGQAVILLLIQLGGLGLITFAVFVLSVVGGNIGLVERRFLAEELNLDSMGNLMPFVKRMLIVFVIGETLGLVLLATQFVPDHGWGMGLWHALFHSVSAFNNAGFSTFPDSLMGYVGNPVVVFTTTILFIVSGIGFLMIWELLRERRWSRLSLHTQLMLVGTPLLIVTGVGGYAVLEWTNPETLAGLDGPLAKLMASWFEGVTPRTAGFNSMDTAGMRDATTLLTMVLMFIGAGATSTAGGVKVTTAFVLLLATIAFFHRSGVMRFQRHEIAQEDGLKVMALLFVGLMTIFTALFALVLAHDIDFLDAAFEVFSAFGTVGLSRGATGELGTTGKIVIIGVMFLGRIGPLTLGFILADKVLPRVRYPEGRVHLG